MLLENFQITEAAHHELMSQTPKNKKSDHKKKSHLRREVWEIILLNRPVSRLF